MSLDSRITGFVAFWISGSAGSAITGFRLAQNDISYSNLLDITVIFAVFLQKRLFFTHKFLPLLTVYPPRLNKSYYKLARM